jgi:hypothetical protein
MTSIAPSAAERTYAPAVEALGLVLAVAHPTRPRPFLLASNNVHAGTMETVAEAAATGLAYVVTVGPDVLAFDLDGAVLVLAGNALYAELAAESWPAFRIRSGRSGHCHLWAVVPDPQERARFAARAAALGLAPRAAMRPPGAPHRLGLAVTPIDDPTDFIDAATVARIAADTRPNGSDWRTLLKTGRWPAGWPGRDRSGSAKVWQVCIGAIRAGYQLDDVRPWLADLENRGGQSYRAKLGRPGKRHGDYWLAQHVWPSATKAAAVRVLPPADATEARERLYALSEAVDAHAWTGKAGTTDRAVLRALIARGHARGSLTPTMSFRELAQAAPCALRTVQRSVDRLRAAGWFQVVDRGRGRTVLDDDGGYREQAHATQWRLLVPRELTTRVVTPPARTSLSVVTTRDPVSALRSTADVCRWRGLGLNAPRVLNALAFGAATAADLAVALNLNRGNLRARLLPRLESHGLVTRASDKWELAADLDAAMEAAAEDFDLTGKADEVAAQHEAERVAYLEWREWLRGRREQTKAANMALDRERARQERAAKVAADTAARRARALTLPGLDPEPPLTIVSEPLESDGRPMGPAGDMGKSAGITHDSADRSSTNRGTPTTQPTHERPRDPGTNGARTTPTVATGNPQPRHEAVRDPGTNGVSATTPVTHGTPARSGTNAWRADADDHSDTDAPPPTPPPTPLEALCAPLVAAGGHGG